MLEKTGPDEQIFRGIPNNALGIKIDLSSGEIEKTLNIGYKVFTLHQVQNACT